MLVGLLREIETPGEEKQIKYLMNLEDFVVNEAKRRNIHYQDNLDKKGLQQFATVLEQAVIRNHLENVPYAFRYEDDFCAVEILQKDEDVLEFLLRNNGYHEVNPQIDVLERWNSHVSLYDLYTGEYSETLEDWLLHMGLCEKENIEAYVGIHFMKEDSRYITLSEIPYFHESIFNMFGEMHYEDVFHIMISTLPKSRMDLIHTLDVLKAELEESEYNDRD